jgi:coproporphyrinogen III oxidase
MSAPLQEVKDKPSSEFIEEFKSWIFGLQDSIVAGLQEFEEKKFVKHPWEKDLRKLYH